MVETSKLSKKEVQELQSYVSYRTTLLRAGFFCLLLIFVALFLFNVIARLTSGFTLYVLSISPTLLLGTILYRTSKKWTGGPALRKNIREDLKNGVARVDTYSVLEAVEIDEQEDEGVGYFLKLEDSRVVFVQSQEVVSWKRRGFPWTRFKVRTAPVSGRFLGIRKDGERLKPSMVRAPLSLDEYKLLNPKSKELFVFTDWDFEALKIPSQRTQMKSIPELTLPVRYSDGVTPVQIGDIVSARLWFAFFRKRIGRVVYVPGISKKHGEFEHDGLCWVGVKTTDGSVFGNVVMPETGCVQKSLHFLERDSSKCDVVTPDTVFPED